MQNLKKIKNLKIQIINIGTELLKDKVNTNLLSIASFLEKFNLKISRSYNVADDKKELKDVVALALDTSDIIFTTGGLGPTIDDITKEVVAEVIGKKLIFSDDIFTKILALLESRGRIVSDELKNNLKNMAYLIDESLVLKNHYGTASGLLCNILWKNEPKTIVILPGPPDEMKSILENDFTTYLKTESWLNFQNFTNFKNFKKLEFQIFGLSESEIDVELRNILISDEVLDFEKNENNGNIDTAILINFGLIYVCFDISLVRDEIQSNGNIEKIYKYLKNRMQIKFGSKILANNNLSIQELVVKKLLEIKNTVSVSESCTGGLICKMLTDISGSSDCFLGGIVAYSNEIKIKSLGVNEETLLKFGAVSEQTAIQMAEGALKKFETDYAISTTGIAGPNGGTKNKPVGLVYIAVASKNSNTEIIKLNFGGDRDTIRQRASTVALAKLLMLLKDQS
jgi:nicotinamide-nucleotide amidase